MIELVGALAVGMLGLAGVAAWADGALEDSKGQQAALYQAQLTQAARRYIDANYATLRAQAGAAPVRIDLAMLKVGGHLAQRQSGANAYGHSPCVLVLPAAAGGLDALVLGEGGTGIPARMLAYVASVSGRGGGFIAAGTPAVAQGAFQSWSVPLARFGGASCSGTAAAANHLASALFFDGPGQLSSDFLYRHAVPGQPQLNRMNTPLHMRAQATEGSSDALCVPGDTATYGRVAVDDSGAVLHCRLGVWRRPGGRWKDAVAVFAALPASGNDSGDVRLAGAPARAFRWDGGAWKALPVDQSGHLILPGRLTANEALIGPGGPARAACATDGLLAQDADGALLSCQLGKWRSLAESAITGTAFSQSYFGSSRQPSPVEARIMLASLPGSRPLFLTGFSTCQAFDTNDPIVEVFMVNEDAVERKVGGCITDAVINKGRVRIDAVIALQQIPENIVEVRVRLKNPSAGPVGNLSSLSLAILNSR